MAVPKKKRSLAIRRARRSTNKIFNLNLTQCPICKKLKRTHYLCAHNL